MFQIVTHKPFICGNHTVSMNKSRQLLIVFFFISLAVRLYFAFQAPHLSLDGYFMERQVSHIMETGTPLYFDELSYGGRTHLFLPAYAYILAAFSFFMPFALVAKIVPNIFASLIVFSAYLVAKNITKREGASLFTAFISIFIPIFFVRTFNSISPLSLALPLIVYQIYCFLNPKEKSFQFVVLTFLLPLIHHSAIIVPIGLVLFFIISKIEHMKVGDEHKEMILFSLVVTLWMTFLVYKDAFLTQGIGFILRPDSLLLAGDSLGSYPLVQSIYLIGIIPFFYGVTSAYHFLFKKQNLSGFVLLSLVLTAFALLWTGFVDLVSGIMFLGVFLTVLFSYYYFAMKSYLDKTRFSHVKYYTHYFIVSVTITFVITSIIPTVLLAQEEVSESLKQPEFEGFEWIGKNTPEDSIVLAGLGEGHALSSIGKRANFMDDQILLIDDAKQRYDAYVGMYRSPFVTETVSLLNRNGIEYIYLSERTAESLDVNREKFNDDCFKNVFANTDVTIYEVICRLKSS